ncbi:MAG: hypothetical protein BGP08_11030 [Rhizobiales bacterium 64-17]|nr:MAG: hypothetical protein BGP08_11030 [Rhizobiales bacterium 64-17]
MRAFLVALFLIVFGAMNAACAGYQGQQVQPSAGAVEVFDARVLSLSAVDKDDVSPKKIHFLISMDSVCGAHCPDCAHPAYAAANMHVKSETMPFADFSNDWRSLRGRLERPPCG